MKKIISALLALALCLSLVACGGGAEPEPVDLQDLYEGFGDRLPDMFYPDETTMLDFLGIQAEDCQQYQVAICAEGMRCDEIWLLQAKDEAALEELRQLAQSRIQSKLDETETYAPDQYLVVQQAQLLTNGLYLALVISPEAQTLAAEVEAAFQGA